MARSVYLPGYWPWLLVGGLLAYAILFVVKFVRHRRFYNGLVSISIAASSIASAYRYSLRRRIACYLET
jgi:hypothetical protein